MCLSVTFYLRIHIDLRHHNTCFEPLLNSTLVRDNPLATCVWCGTLVKDAARASAYSAINLPTQAPHTAMVNRRESMKAGHAGDAGDAGDMQNDA